ncbi:hypothetical protein STRDD13_00871 [Streptococcus sp. DD13]|nr:hypothetical protein STRDD13_00871 [Streptococcus sp. DD13]
MKANADFLKLFILGERADENNRSVSKNRYEKEINLPCSTGRIPNF